ncbi:YeeE/YedE family protein [Leptothrix discophora]|uniref:YeeE/YedE family protein n=1 Tax=Leptothrix discophora TaxID=89 RepID=A0ABT9G8C1_LEPDI|nr:YeeE/YedE family protein [Leptothrix discophora]MDP4302537.1 YeeE/YedE family protein [Leptothrix discophora]
MPIDALLAWLGEEHAIAALGAVIGVLFGFFAHRSRFCLRSAVIEFARGTREGKLTVWLYTFSTAVLLTQLFIVAGWLDVSGARQLSARGSLSGAAIGGAMFGAGMILARGCSSRLLVLAAQGNLRALLSGLVFAVSAQAALTGVLSPLRLAIAGWWTVDGGAARDVLAISGLGHGGGIAFGALWLAAALVWGRRQQVRFWGWFGAVGVGVLVALAWLGTGWMSRSAFDLIVPVQSLSFTGPAADTLMLVLSPPGQALKFDLGLVPGVAIGAFISALLWRELKLEGFQGGQAMRRYIAGAFLMGFGGMLAGGCAVGAGVSGASVYTLTSWLTLLAMWSSASLTDWLVDRREEALQTPTAAEVTDPDLGASYARP